MKKLIYLFSLLLPVFMVVSCENNSDVPESKVTYFPRMEINGKSTMTLDCGTTSFADPGAQAYAGEATVDITASALGRYYGGTEVNSPDVYDITYVAINDDGIPGSIFRTVYNPPCNGDFVSSIAGVYSASMTRTTLSSGGTRSFSGLGPVYVRDMGSNVFQLSDAIGGWYEYGYGYGWEYSFPGMNVTANNIGADNFTFGSDIEGGPWGGAVTLKSFSVDAGTKTISYSVEWELGYLWEITLTQE